MEEAKERFYHYHDDTRSAFDELCAMVDALNVSTIYVKGKTPLDLEVKKIWVILQV